MTGLIRSLALGGVGVTLAGVLVTQVSQEPAAPPAASSNPVSSTAPRPEAPVADVRIEMLKIQRPELGRTERNPFRFEARPAAPPRPVVIAPRPPVIALPPAPAGPPPPPAITLRYFGLLDSPRQAVRVATFSDGRGNVFTGKEGDIIEGRYRVIRIGPDSAELAYLDGRGRQTIRLSGQ